ASSRCSPGSEPPPARATGTSRTASIPATTRRATRVTSLSIFQARLETSSRVGRPTYEDGSGGPFRRGERASIIRGMSLALQDEIAKLLNTPEDGAGAPSLATLEQRRSEEHTSELQSRQ